MGRLLNVVIAVLLLATAILWATTMEEVAGGWRWGMVALSLVAAAAAMAAARK